MVILNKYSIISGLEVNVQKSALNISLFEIERLVVQASLPFKWAAHSLPYLGIQLTANPLDLFAANYPALLKLATHLLATWSSIPSSWFGKINIIKMTILPKNSYIYLHIPAYFLRIIQQKVIQFTWWKIKPRLPRNTLYLPKIMGGLCFPNFSLYYRAAELVQLSKYHSTIETPLWVAIEAMNCDPLSIKISYGYESTTDRL